MPSRKAITEHGEVEYETVECISCGEEAMPEEMETLVVGKLQKDPFHATRSVKYTFKNKTAHSGPVCEYCSGSPAGLPQKPDAAAGAVTVVAGWLAEVTDHAADDFRTYKRIVQSIAGFLMVMGFFFTVVLFFNIVGIW